MRLTGKQMLEMILDLEANVDILESEYEECFSRGTRVTPTYKSDCVQESGTSDKVADNAIRLVEAFNDFNNAWDKYIDHKRECMKYLIGIKDKKYRKLLYYRYFKGFNWKDVAFVIGYSEEHTKGHLHKSALFLFEKNKRNNTE